MERERIEEMISAAKAIGAENDKISALLLLPEVTSDGRLTAHYLQRQREIAPVLRAFQAVTEQPSDENLADLSRELLLLRVAARGDAAEYAGAGVCVRMRNIKDSVDQTDLLARLRAILRGDWLLKESGVLFRAECLSADAYLILSAMGQGALGAEATFAVYPILPPPVVRDEDVRTDIFLNGGKGGQNVNKVETAVRMTHVPTGVTVVCRDERSQLQNKKRAARLLKERVAEYCAEAQSALVEKAKRSVSIGN